ncbi:recombinase family protein [Aquimarina algiphila]|uniref:Recombinase family protein n=1 Tax=Aquimarina algiphila TaxID=2047982 RepID=A0A554VEF8_9FLAO|nr:recombinase family protein [Aquimarina algiphila]TSE05416.1 recombinase family protein [Aquimarina algiphila]
MSTLEQFQDFAKKNKQQIISNNKAVIYTRVSDIKQKDNTSLETQKEICTQFALRKGLDVLHYFGGTNESAKTDERKHYKAMLKWVRQKKIGHIIVYSFERYSRTGGNAINTIDLLKVKGVNVLSATQDIDPNTPTGYFMQSFQLLYGRYDNDIRRQKTVQGMRKRLLDGYYMGVAPLGYKNTRNEQNIPIIVPNEDAKFIRKAFMWKAQENIPNADIVERLEMQGLKIYRQRLTEIFRNPIYCGLISHGLLQGKVVQGNHDPIISKNIFLKVNGIQSKNHQNYRHNPENENLPLKGFAKCTSCKSPLTGFLVKKKGIHYYKCKTIGCSCTKNTKLLHEQFEKILSHFEIDKKMIAPLKKQLQFTFQYYFKSKKDDTAALKHNLKGLLEKIEKIEERYVFGEIDTHLYQKFTKKLNVEKEQIEEEIKTNSLKSSNLDFYIDICMKLFSNLNKLWKLSSYNEKQRLQKMLFPNGILYSKEKDKVQTLEINPVMALLSSLSMNYTKNKSGQNLALASLSAVVTSAGFKPATS